MNSDVTTHSAAASQERPEDRALRFQVTNVSLVQNGQGTVRGLSLATLAATLAACGGGGSGGPAAPPPAPEPEPENNPPTAAAATATATEDGDPASGDAVGSDEDGDDLTYSVSKQGELGTLALADDGKWTYTITDSPQIQALGAAATLTDTAEIQVSDGEDSATATVTITIQGANDAPTAEAGAAEVTAGDAATAQGSLNATDVDEGDTHTFAVTREPAHGTLTVDAAGDWTYALNDGDPAVRALGHGETATDSGEVTATDSSGADNATAAAEVTVTITGIVDAPAVSAPAGVEENDATERPLAEVTSPDDGVTFAVDNPKFEVQTVGSTASLKLKAGESLDFESDADEDGNVTLMVTATDDEGNTSAPTPVTVAVTNVNEAPSVVAQAMTVDAAKADEIDPDLTIPENSDGKAPGAVVAHIAVSDPDAGDSLTVAVSDDDRFEVIDAHGEKWLKLKEGQSLDHEGEPTIEVTLTATDDGDPAMSGTHKVTITVTDANDAPSITVQKATVPEAKAAEIDPDLTIPEDSDGSIPGAVVAHIAVSDPDAGDTHTVTASDDRFEVIDAHGQKWLKLKEGAKLDHETEGTIEVTVTVTDQDGLSDSMPVTVTVTDADEAPSAPKPGSGTANINENFLGASITTVGGSVDPEGDDITYRVDNPDFEITGDGILKLRDGASLDFEEQPTVTVNLTAVDSKGNVSEPTPVTVTVGDLHENAAPSVAVAPGQDLTVQETGSAEAGALLIELETSDDDADDTHTVTVAGDDRFETREADDGTWSLVLKEGASLDHEDGDGTITLTLTAADDGDPAASGTAEVVIEVTDANEAPTVTVTGGATVPNDDMTVSSLSVDENAPGSALPPLALITLTDPDDGEALKGQAAADKITITGEQADKFRIKLDPEDGLWLALRDDESLDHETAATIDLTVTFEDKGGLTASASATVTVSDVNEKPFVTDDDMGNPRTLPPVFATVGEDIDITVHLAGLFDDPDDDDGTFKYSLRTDPGLRKSGDTTDKGQLGFELSIERGTDDDDKETITGTISSDGSIWSNHLPGTFDITVVATDDDDDNPLPGETTFHIILDDGDDDITAIHLYHPADADGDEARNVDYEVDVDENDASEVIFGRIRVVDQDSADHPHGQHEVTVDNKKFEIKEDADGGFWLALKAGNALDHETDDPIELTITAKPMTVDSEGKIVVNKDATTHETQTVEVIVNDVNDAPKAIKNPGNWWVIVDDEEHDKDDVDAGDWLSFRLEMDDGDDSTTEYPAFTDEDDGKNGDLRYELVNAPDWLEIDDETGVIRNKAKMLAPESGGTYRVTVEATDNEGADDGLSDQFTFQLVVAFSGADDDDNLYQDNDEPQLSRGTVNDIRENPKDGVLVATFTVRDDDSALVGHPFAPRMPEITGVVNNDDEDDTNNDDGTAEDRSGYSTAFKIEHASGNSYRIVTTKDAGELLDYETVEDITISLSVEDGTGASDTLDISVDIDNVNEAPVKASGYAGAGNTAVAVEQSAAGKRYLWINLYDFWEDLDERQDDDDLTFTATTNVPWIKVLHRPQKWEDLEEGKDDDDDDDDVTWGTIVTGTGDDQVTVVADDAGGTPDDDDFVVVFEIDRTKANNKQADVAAGGTITLTARDEGGAIAAKPETIKVNVTDENLDIGANEKAVTLSGSTREGATLKARFDETKDPDLVGDPEAYQVVYTWSAGASSDGTGGTVRQAGLSDSYTMTQADVGMYINVAVTYRELLPAGTTMDFGTGAAQTGGSAVTTGTVRNAQDDGEAHFNILTNGSTGLTAEVRIIDEDGVPNAGETGAPVYTWQQSANGVSGWEVADGDDVTTDQILTLANGNGLYYRLVVTYTDEQGGTERIASDGVKVGDVAALADTATPSLTGQWVIGGTQRVNAPEVKDVTVGVQWQMRMNAGTVEDPEFYWVDIAGATGRTLAITSDYAGASLRVVVTHSDKAGITSTTILPSSTGQAISDTITNTAPRATMTEDYEIEAQIDDTKGVVVTKVTHPVPVATLFDDLDGDTLTYTVTAGPGTDLVPTVASDPKSGAIWISADDAGLLSFDANTGELIYVTDEKGSHGGDDTDGGGNVVSLTIQASDGTAQATTDVDIRLNVKPTDIMVDHSSDTSVVEGEKISANTTVATLNVEDENSGSHKFGTHKVTVDDDRFQVVKDTDTDGSTWLLQVKKDAVFEFMEVDDKNMPLPLDTAQNVKVKLTATDGGDKKATFTIMRDGKEVEVDYKEITVTALDITNATKDDADAPVPAAEIPGLDDDADDGEADERVDGSGDEDVDGGWKPAEDMMSSIAMLDDGLF